MKNETEIPEDVREAALKCAETVCRNLPDDYGDISVEVQAIASAILAERERCAKLVESLKLVANLGHMSPPTDPVLIYDAQHLIAKAIRRNPSP